MLEFPLTSPLFRRVAILQSNYIPWKGYFDIIGSVDAFVVYDDVQYTKNHWHNRNLIKTSAGPSWLTIPVSRQEGSFVAIDRVRIAKPFAAQHFSRIEQSYARAPHFAEYRDWLAGLYEQAGRMDLLSDINLLFMRAICQKLGLTTPFFSAREMAIEGGQTDRLVNICRALGAETYVSGPSARSYLDQEKFAQAGIAIEWVDYAGYPEYRQLHGPFTHTVTVLDLLLNEGASAPRFMKLHAGQQAHPAGQAV